MPLAGGAMAPIENMRDDDVPLHEYMGMVLEDRDDGTSRVTLPLTDAVRGAVAPVHGGMLATLGDLACAAAIGDYDGSHSIPVSIDLHVRFFRQPKQSPLVAEGRVVHRGSRIISAECVVHDSAGRQVARVVGTYMVIAGFGDLAAELPHQPAGS